MGFARFREEIKEMELLFAKIGILNSGPDIFFAFCVTKSYTPGLSLTPDPFSNLLMMSVTNLSEKPAINDQNIIFA